MTCYCNENSRLIHHLRLASTLARCDDIIQALRSKEPVSRDDTKWLFNAMNINGANSDAGCISHQLVELDPSLVHDVVEVSRRVNLQPPVLRHSDWDLMLCGVELLRRNLLG